MVRLIGLTALGCALLAGCGGDRSGQVTESSHAQDPADLPGQAFVAHALSEDGKPQPIVPETEIVVSFEENGKIAWDSGCNRGSSDLQIAEDRLTIEDKFGSTLRGCPGALGEQEQWLIALLTSDPEWRLGSGLLTLTSGPRRLELQAKS